MDSIRELYQQVILDHNRAPHNCFCLKEANHKAEGFNPLCGDKVTFYLLIDHHHRIEKVSFTGKGCAISTASASMLTDFLTGKTIAEAEKLFTEFQKMLTQEQAEANPELGKLKILAGVKEFPSRVKCATLAWHTVRAAINNQVEPASTECGSHE